MKFNFKKVTAIATSVLLTGMTVGSAIAASDNSLVDANITKVVYGSGASALDQTQAVNIENYIKDNSDSTSTVTAGEDAITEDEVVLGGLITASGSNIETTIKNNKLNGLIDEKLSWDDGEGSDDYDVHEEIAIGTMKVLTTLDDKKLEGVALDNELGLEYKYIFEGRIKR
jgi:hypothetical protein